MLATRKAQKIKDKKTCNHQIFCSRSFSLSLTHSLRHRHAHTHKCTHTYHDYRGLCWRSLFGRVVRAPLSLADTEEHAGVTSLHSQHATLGVKGRDLFLVAPDLLGQLLYQ